MCSKYSFNEKRLFLLLGYFPTDFNLDLQFSLEWLKHLRPVAFGIVSASASNRAFSPSVTDTQAFLDNSGQLAKTADAMFL